MRKVALTALFVYLAAGCKNTDFASSPGYKTGKERNAGDSTKGDLLGNSAFDDDQDSEGSDAGDAGDGDLGSSDSGAGGLEGDGDSSNPNAPASLIEIIRLCSNRMTESAGTNLKLASGAIASLIPMEGTKGEPMHFHDAATAHRLKRDIMNYGAFKLPLGKLQSGKHRLVVCDAAQPQACASAGGGDPDDPRQWRFGHTRGVLGTSVIEVQNGQKLALTGAFMRGEKARMEILTDKNAADTAMKASFLSTFAAMASGGGVEMIPQPQLNMEELKDCDETASPLIVDLNNDGVSLTAPTEGAKFDVDADGVTDLVSWPASADDRFVVLDKNDDDKINDGSEMFGNNTKDVFGSKAANGFLALAAHDANRDGLIDARDPDYAKLRLWHDANRDGITDDGELTPLAAAGVATIDLKYAEAQEKDEYGNVTRQRSVVKLQTGQLRMIVDIWFRKLRP